MEVRRRRIRISFSDPDATDSDSGEEASSSASDSGEEASSSASDSGEEASSSASASASASASCGKTTKIVILHCSSSSSSARKNPGGCGSQQKQAMAIRSSAASCRERAVGSPPVMKRCRGVYERQPGRWAAEFRSHRLKARHWIGTFATEEEAMAAYDDFERQFFPSRCCGGLPLPAVLERGHGRAAAGVQRPSHPHGPHRQRRHPPNDSEKRQIVQALAATGIMLPPLPSASAPCVSNSTPAPAPPPPPPLVVPALPTPFENALPSVHWFWADEPADEDLVGLADLGHLPLPFSDGSMDFDPADLSLFDGFL